MTYSSVKLLIQAISQVIEDYKFILSVSTKEKALERFRDSIKSHYVTTTTYEKLTTEALVKIQAEFAKFPKELGLEFSSTSQFVREPQGGFGGESFPLEEKLGKPLYDKYIAIKKECNEKLAAVKAGFRIQDYNRGGFATK